jgi:hypothetical protein
MAPKGPLKATTQLGCCSSGYNECHRVVFVITAQILKTMRFENKDGGGIIKMEG